MTKTSLQSWGDDDSWYYGPCTRISVWFTHCFSHSSDAWNSKEVVLLSEGSCQFAICPLTDTVTDFWCSQAGLALGRSKLRPEGQTLYRCGPVQQKPRSLLQTLPWSIGRSCLISHKQMTNLADAHKPFPEVRRSSTATEYTDHSRIHMPAQTTACHLCTRTETD